jgi:hypothetical protein
VRPSDIAAQKLDLLVPFSLARPLYGDLVPAFAGETTLYGEAPKVRLRSGRPRWTVTWNELVYEAETNLGRHEIQQRIWRRRNVAEEG